LKKNILIIVLIFIVVVSFSFSQIKNNKKIIVVGTIAVIGNAPFLYLIIKNDEVSYSIVGEKKSIIWKNYQGEKIKVEGIVLEKRDLFSNQLNVTKILE